MHLFILVLGPLLCVIKSNKNMKSLKHFRLPIHFLSSAYSNDISLLILFIKYKNSVFEILNILHSFLGVSGLKHNIGKWKIVRISALKSGVCNSCALWHEID